MADEDIDCCCDLFRCCCGCIFSLICETLINIIIIVGIFALFFWLIIHPSRLKFHATNTTLTQFNFTNNNTLHYNLALNITIRNPNKRVGIYYDNIEMLTFYKDVRFGSQTLGTFFQHHKNTSVLNQAFKGQQLIPLSADQISEFEEEKSDGVYNINVKLLLMIRFKLGLIKTGNAKSEVRCDLKIPLKSNNGTSSESEFQATACDWDYKWRFFQ